MSESAAAAVAALTLGVAGHVDHGKTSLVRALTGVETDRLPEERRRGISIELGFAPLQVSSPRGPLTWGLVDMPGHERFVRRMIAGAVGIDAVLLVVAADEGVMPQAREHLAICGLLGIRHGLIVITKADLADPELLDLLELELADSVRGTFLDGAAMVRFSARAPDSYLPGLHAALAALAGTLQAEDATARARSLPFRMPIDRAFTLRGRGTVVTGTAAAGVVFEGDVLRVAPGDATFRVRALQRHGADVAAFAAPGRLAVQLAGAALDDAPVGCVLAADDAVVVGQRCDAELYVLPSAPAPLARRSRWTLHVGTAVVPASVVPLAVAELAPGERGVVQLHLDQPVALAAGDALVLRGSHDDPRHGRTVAGGRVLHPAPPRHRLGDGDVAALLGRVAAGDEADRLEALVALAGEAGIPVDALGRWAGLPPARLERLCARLLGHGKLRRLGQPAVWLAPAALATLQRRVEDAVAAFHAAEPGRDGIDRGELARRAAPWAAATTVAAIVALAVRAGRLREAGALIATTGFEPRAAGPDPAVCAAIVTVLAAAGLTPPTGAALADAIAACVRDSGHAAPSPAALRLAWEHLLRDGEVVRQSETYFATSALRAMTATLARDHADGSAFDLASLKERFGLSRKYLIPLVELLDARRLTVRDPAGNRVFRARVLAAMAEGASPWDAVG